MLSIRKNAIKATSIVVCILIAIVISFSLICTSVKKGGTAVAARLIDEHTQNGVDATTLMFDGYIKQVKLISSIISDTPNFNLEDAKELKNSVLSNTEFTSLGARYLDGRNFSTDDIQLVNEDVVTISPTFTGKTIIAPAKYKNINGESSLLISVPIYKGTDILGIAYVKTACTSLSNDYIKSEADDIKTFVVDSDFNNLFLSTDTTPLQMVKHLPSDKQVSLLEQMRNRTLTRQIFEVDGKVMSLSPTQYESFFIFTSLSFNVIFERAWQAINVALTAILAFMIIFSVVLFFVIRYYNRSKKRIKNAGLELETLMSNVQGGVVRFELNPNLYIRYLNQGLLFITGFSHRDLKSQLKNSFMEFIHIDDRIRFKKLLKKQSSNNLPIDMNCRINNKDGSYSWFLIRGNPLNLKDSPKSYLCILTDITTMKHAEQELHLTMQRYSVIIEQSDSIIFEYSYRDKTVYLSNKWDDKFDFSPHTENFLEVAVETQFVHPEDAKKARDILISIKEGAAFKSGDIRLKNNEGEYIWCTLKASAIFDEAGRVYKTVGRIADVNKRYRETEMLKKKAELDSLTGIYNKQTTQMLIDNYLEVEGKDGNHALLIIDIDNFKCVNDTLGHLAGDAVITDVVTKAKALLRSGDIFGRIGGDEFVILLKGAGNIHNIRAKATELCNAFVHTVYSDDKSINVSSSIGIAFYGKITKNYKQLVDKADTALYEAKKNGKNQFAIYGE